MEIKQIIFDELHKVTKKNFNLDTNVKELNIDSLDLAMLVVDLENKFNITISDEELMSIQQIKDIINLVEKNLN
ncbi:acyl carrier protein [Mycoplasma sp. NEAQ87857]|uniref:phosphopantetheine-binding protein n=1 Tax=Mycoplasma sp. NEAQ87857 TaxID=2683967 RepID=UPI001315DD38|nr:phosphopantetheine-binding protein [Mycoplasma sp. NEAQ87857]QGZ97674.1 acyl carrier protein [Mycoplasma sp. NEAQ87857]